MHTRAKKKYVASDRARRENVPRHILSYTAGDLAAVVWAAVISTFGTPAASCHIVF